MPITEATAMKLIKTVTFEAAHRLMDYGVHGHSYRVTVEIDGQPDKATGLVKDFGAIERAIKERFDHRLLNDFMEHPTMELMAIAIGRLVDAQVVTLERPSLNESVRWVNFEIPPRK